MENFIKELNVQLKSHNDSKSQIKVITQLNNIQEDLKKSEKVITRLTFLLLLEKNY